jgi:UDP-glucuronate decarboxylase
MNSNVLTEDFKSILKDKNIDFGQLKNSTVLISGATGFIGSMLIKCLIYANQNLNLNITIYGLARNKEKLYKIFNDEEISLFGVFYGDITQPYSSYIPQNIDIDYIFHTANITTSSYMITHPISTILIAIDGTRQMLDLAVSTKVKSFIYISSMEMYGSFASTDSDFACTENDLGFIDPLKVRSDYPESKRMCENMCIAYAAENKVPVKIARLSQTFGAGILPWENRIFAQFAHSVMYSQDIILHTAGLSEGNYCYISDTLRGLFTILLCGQNSEAYNVVNERAHTTIAKMAEMVCHDIAHENIKVIFDIPDDNKFGYAADTKLKLSGKKLESLGWMPQFNLKDMYIRLIKYLEETQKGQ